MLQRAVWPRVLTFSAPESLGVQGGDEPLLLGLAVTDPEIVRTSNRYARMGIFAPVLASPRRRTSFYEFSVFAFDANVTRADAMSGCVGEQSLHKSVCELQAPTRVLFIRPSPAGTGSRVWITSRAALWDVSLLKRRTLGDPLAQNSSRGLMATVVHLFRLASPTHGSAFSLVPRTSRKDDR